MTLRRLTAGASTALATSAIATVTAALLGASLGASFFISALVALASVLILEWPQTVKSVRSLMATWSELRRQTRFPEEFVELHLGLVNLFPTVPSDQDADWISFEMSFQNHAGAIIDVTGIHGTFVISNMQPADPLPPVRGVSIEPHCSSPPIKISVRIHGNPRERLSTIRRRGMGSATFKVEVTCRVNKQEMTFEADTIDYFGFEQAELELGEPENKCR